MKTQRISSAHVHRDEPVAKGTRKAADDTFTRGSHGASAVVRMGVGALAWFAALEGAAACNGLNPMHKGWQAPPDAWPDAPNYGDIVALMASDATGPSCRVNDGASSLNGAMAFYQTTFDCAGSFGVGFCSASGDLTNTDNVQACHGLGSYQSNWPGDIVLRPIATCGVLRAKDCIYFFPNDTNFQTIEDSFARAFAPTCQGFNPRQPHWTAGDAGWPNALSVDALTAIVEGCSAGPACGTAFNYGIASFDCAGQPGSIVGQADLNAALQAAQSACNGTWTALTAPPQAPLIPYNQTMVQQAWDVGFFFTDAGSTNLDAALVAAAGKEFGILRRRHDARYMWRAGVVSGAVTTTLTVVTFGFAQGSLVHNLGVSLGMGYGAGAIGIAVSGVMLGWQRIDTVGRVLSAVGVGASGVVYLGVLGRMVFRD